MSHGNPQANQETAKTSDENPQVKHVNLKVNRRNYVNHIPLSVDKGNPQMNHRYPHVSHECE